MASNHQLAVATHILLVLAHLPAEYRKENGLVSSEAVAASVNTHAVVVRRVVGLLARSGLVRTQAGKGGGLELGRPANRITLLDVHLALEDPEVFAYKANLPNARCPIGSKVIGVLSPVFDDVQASVHKSLKKTTLADLVAQMG